MRGRTSQGLMLYKRHGGSCTLKDKFRFDCDCVIWIYGRLPNGDTLERQSTKTSVLRQAEAMRDAELRHHAAQEQDNRDFGPTLVYCIEQHIASQENKLKPRTLFQTRYMLNQFQSFAQKHGVVYIRDVTVDIVELFRTSLNQKKSTTIQTTIAKLRTFMKAAYRRAWITESMALKIEPHAASSAQALPYSDAEIEKILDGCYLLRQVKTGTPFAYALDTLRLLLELMLATGMRIGDALIYDPKQTEPDETIHSGQVLWVYTYQPQKQRLQKKTKTAEAYISDDLKTRIDTCKWMTPGRFPFYYGVFSEEERYCRASTVRALMKRMEKQIDVEDCRPHRLRDTFAVRCLLAGMNLEDVSRLLNHASIVITERHYAPWVLARKQRLRQLFAQAMMNPVGHAAGNAKRNPRTRRS